MPTPAARSLCGAPSLPGPIGDRGSWHRVAIAAVATGVVVGLVRSVGLYGTTARTTSLAVLFSSAALIARRRSAPLPLAAALFLVAQPLAARLGYSALPGTVFSFVLALAFWLRSAQRPAAAACVASLLPLARVEGVVVLVVWALVMLGQRAIRNGLLLAAGTVARALASALVSGDLLWLWHHNPHGLLGSA